MIPWKVGCLNYALSLLISVLISLKKTETWHYLSHVGILSIEMKKNYLFIPLVLLFPFSFYMRKIYDLNKTKTDLITEMNEYHFQSFEKKSIYFESGIWE